MNKDHYELKAKLNAIARTRQKKLNENAAMENMETHSVTLWWIVIIALALVTGSLLIDHFFK